MRLSAFALLIVLLGGCSSGSFLGRRFDNFTAYYNTFYNAQKSFEAARKVIRTEDARIDRSRYLQVIDVGGGGAGARDFENAIKKSADVLREHPDSKWVDDALLLIGKSYYYTSNTVGAEQKFREVIERGSGLEDEARFWLGMTLIASGAYSEAGQHLRESIDREDVHRKWKARMQAALGELYVRQERWEDAAEALREVDAAIKDNRMGSRAQFLLGQVYETMEDYDAAIEAYENVGRFNPLYEISYAARFNAIRVKGIYADQEEALRELRGMVRDDKHFQYRAELEYLRGRILQEAGYPIDAVAEYEELLYDSDANISEVRGQIHYQLGVIYRDLLPDFPRAAAHFDTASTAIRVASPRTTGSTVRVAELDPAPGAITDAREQAEMFGSYARHYGTVARFDSLLYLGSLDDEAFLRKIQDIRRQRAEELLAERERERSRALQQGFDRGGSGFEEAGSDTRITPPGSDQTGASGFLFHRDRSKVQEALLSFFDRWGERPLVVNWRRRAAITGQAERDSPDDRSTASRGISDPETESSLPADALLAGVEVDVSDVPRTPERIQDMRTERVRALYELGNVLFLSIDMPDSAASWYRRVVSEGLDLPVTSRALYALAEVQRALGDTARANAIYRQVVNEYPDSEVAGRAAERVGRAGIAAQAPPETRIGDEQYESAYAFWKRGHLDRAMNRMLSLAADYSGDEIAARSLLAAGAIFVDWSEKFRRDVLEPIELGVPDSTWRAVGLYKVAEDSVAEDSTDVASSGAGEQALEAAQDTSATEQTRFDVVPRDSVDVDGTVADTTSEGGAAGRNAPADTTSDVSGREGTAADTTWEGGAASRNAATDTSSEEGSASGNVGADTTSAVYAGQVADTTSERSAGEAMDPDTTGHAAGGEENVAAGANRRSGALQEGDSTSVHDWQEGEQSAPAVADSASAAPSLAAPDTAGTTANVDTVLAAADSSGTHVAPGDSVAAPREPIFLDDIYALIVTKYPETEYARVASGLRDAVAARRQERELAAREVADSASVADSVSVVDSLSVADPLSVADLVSVAAEDSMAVDDLVSVADSASPEKRQNRQDSLAESAAANPGGDPDRQGEREEEEERKEEAEQSVNDRLTPDEAIAEEVDVLPVLVGGAGSLQRMVRYPSEADEGGVRGTVTLSFVVNEQGRAAGVKVEESLGAGCDEEAVRVIRLARYRPAMKEGVPVKYRMQETLTFGPAIQP